jgi:hypothetical protein
MRALRSAARRVQLAMLRTRRVQLALLRAQLAHEPNPTPLLRCDARIALVDADIQLLQLRSAG